MASLDARVSVNKHYIGLLGGNLNNTRVFITNIALACFEEILTLYRMDLDAFFQKKLKLGM